MKFRSVSPDFQEEIREKGSSLCLTRKPSCAIGTVPARPLRIEYPDAWYHVMNRGRRGENTRGHIVLLLRDNPWFTH